MVSACCVVGSVETVCIKLTVDTACAFMVPVEVSLMMQIVKAQTKAPV